jgi:hypothetical protein
MFAAPRCGLLLNDPRTCIGLKQSRKGGKLLSEKLTLTPHNHPHASAPEVSESLAMLCSSRLTLLVSELEDFS